MTKPTTKSPTERRLRKQIRELLTVYKADPKRNEDNIVRELLAIIDDEVRRTRMGYPPITIALSNALDNVRAAVPHW